MKIVEAMFSAFNKLMHIWPVHTNGELITFSGRAALTLKRRGELSVSGHVRGQKAVQSKRDSKGRV